MHSTQQLELSKKSEKQRAEDFNFVTKIIFGKMAYQHDSDTSNFE